MYKFIDNIATADIAVSIEADSLSDIFAESASALLAVLTADPASVKCHSTQILSLIAENPEMLLFDFIAELIFLKDARDFLTNTAVVRVSQHGETWQVDARLQGESIDRLRHDLRVDVKAITLHRFKLEQIGSQWQAFLILDL